LRYIITDPQYINLSVQDNHSIQSNDSSQNLISSNESLLNINQRSHSFIFKWIKQYGNGETKFQKNLATKRYFSNKKNAALLIALIFFVNIFLFGLTNKLEGSQLILLIVAFLINIFLAIILSLF
jgi:hypothetical protein